MNFKDEVENSLANLRELSNKVESSGLSDVVDQYIRVDVLLFEWYYLLIWEQYCDQKNNEKQRNLVKHYAHKLFHFYDNDLKNRDRDLPEILEMGQGGEELLGWLSYPLKSGVLGSDGFLESVKKAMRKDKVCVEQRHTTKSIDDLKLDEKSKFINLMHTHGWAFKVGWLDCTITQKKGSDHSLTCLSGYKKPPNVLWCSNGQKGDWLILCHELGHVMHYNLAMDNQNFYQFEPSILVKEIIAFFWEALSLMYMVQHTEPLEANVFMSDYKKQSGWYTSNAESLKQQNKVEYASYYPLARAIGEHLALALQNNRVSREQITDYMSMGANLKVSTLMHAAGIKDFNNEPTTAH